MAAHQRSEYSDGTKRVPYCTVCGYEYPVGDCPGKYVERSTGSSTKKVDKDTEQN
jgi:hypothetical protein